MKPIKSILVTGAASGIGLACAERLLKEGHSVAAVDIQPFPSALTVADKNRLVLVKADVSKAANCKRAVKRAVAAFKGLDGVIHMAAVHSTKTWQQLDAAEFNRTLAVNVTGSFLIAQAAAGYMAGHGGGAIVLCASGIMNSGGVGGHGRGGPAYASSKAAIVGLTRALARSLAEKGVRVNAIAPGATATAMTAHYDKDAIKAIADRTQLKRIGKPDEIAAVACFLASDEASYIVGEVVQVNGGGSFA